MNLRLPELTDARVLVAGDVMLDRYWHGNSRRVSPEAPVPVVDVNGEERRAGGAANVAMNVEALGAQPHLIGLTGADEPADQLAAVLDARGISYQLHRCDGQPTCVKLRVIAQQQQMLRMDFEGSFAGRDGGWLQRTVAQQLESVDAVVLSDYAKGSLHAVQAIIAAARAQNKPTLVDPIGVDFQRYQGATVITPNRAELEAVVGPCRSESELLERAEQLRSALGLEALLITHGEEGMTLLEHGAAPWHLPTCAREVFDVTGAGDTVVASMAAALAAGSSLRDAVMLANLAAGIVVGKLGTATASLAEVREALHGAGDSSCAQVDELTLLDLRAAARARGERVIMTNGCFDILHAGHVACLQYARALGDRLIVAVNSDASVRRLKGAQRPVNPLASRLQVLAALQCVDWVVPFEEDTPERLYSLLMPDVIVKGGDYRREQIAGAGAVCAGGGEVITFDLLAGHSTSAIIERLRGSA